MRIASDHDLGEFPSLDSGIVTRQADLAVECGPRPLWSVVQMTELYQLQRLLWDIRHDEETSKRFRIAPDEVMDRYGLSDPDRLAMETGDFGSLVRHGANPLLVLIGALKVGVSRDDYYRRLRSEGSEPAGRSGS